MVVISAMVVIPNVLQIVSFFAAVLVHFQSAIPMRIGNARYGLWIVIVCQLQKSHFRHRSERNCSFSLFFCVWDENCENPFHSREQELVRQSALCARKPGLSSISCLEEDTHHFKIAMVFADLSSVMRHRMALLSVFSRIRSE